MIYIAIAFLLLILSYRYDYCHKDRGKDFWYILVLLVFISVAGFRYRLGSDTLNYIHFFSREIKPIEDMSMKEIMNFRYAPGFVVLCCVFRTFTDDFTWFQVFHSIFVNCVVFWFIRKNCHHIFFALFLFFFYLYFLFLFQQMRESMAASIFFLAWPFFKDGKWIQWYVASAIAFLFHVSAFVLFLLPLICLPGIRNIFVFGKRTIIVGIVILVVGYAIQSMFFDLIRAVAVTDSMAERAQTYNKSSLGVSQWNIGGMLLHSMRYLVYPIVMMYFLKKKGERTINVFPDTNGRWQAMVMMSIYISFFTLFITIVLRYTNYFFLFVIITMSDWTFSKVRLFGKTYALQFGYWIVFFIPMLWADAQSEYFGAINKSGTLRQYMVYYPYSSCFDQSRDVNREKCYKYYSVYRD